MQDPTFGSLQSTPFTSTCVLAGRVWGPHFRLGHGSYIIFRTVYLTDPSNDQLVKDEGAQIFYSIRTQTKPIGIGVNCEIPHNPSLTMWLQRLEPMTWL